jgi:hypothetical protein
MVIEIRANTPGVELELKQLVYYYILSTVAVHAQKTPGATSRRPAATSDLPLLVPSYLVFTVTWQPRAVIRTHLFPSYLP